VATPTPASAGVGETDSSQFCPQCGLKIAADSEVGSLTAFLFQDTRCKCPPDQAFADGQMSDRFWKLKKAGAGTIFARGSTSKSASKAPSIDLAPGATIGGIYKIIELIGFGNMGEIYLASHEALGKKCALKVVPPEQVTEVGWRRFQLEARAVAKLNHVNLVRVTDLGIHEGCLPFYAMDYIQGENLAELLYEHGPMPLNMVLDLFMQVCDGVECAHRAGILHRDLKPANIMVVTDNSGKKQAKVLDFGLAKLTKHDRAKQSLTGIGEVFGSPLYMSPEQCSGEKVDNRSDIYSLGCTIFECLTGKPPFPGLTTAAIFNGHQQQDPPALETFVGGGKFPESMELVIAKLLRKNPVERYQTLLELRRDLEKVSRGELVQPFYVSRSNQRSDRHSQPWSEAEREDLAGSAAKIPLGPGIAILAAVTIIGATGFVIAVLLGKRTYSPKPTALSNLQASKDSKIGISTVQKPTFIPPTPPSARDTEAISMLYERGGRKWRWFNFPQDTTIGYLCDTEPDAKNREATGRMMLPAADRLMLEPYPVAIRNPNYLKRFSSGDLYGLNLRLDPKKEGEVGELTANNYLHAMSFVPGVQRLDINAINGVSMTDKDLPALEKFKSLKVLQVYYRSIDLNTLSKLSTLNNLEYIYLEGGGNGDVTPVLQALKNSTHIKDIYLHCPKLSLDGVESIASMPELQHLTLLQVTPSDSTFTAQALKILSKAPKLEQLYIFHSSINAEAITALKAFKKLKRLTLFPLDDGANSLDKIQLLKEVSHLPYKTLIDKQ